MSNKMRRIKLIISGLVPFLLLMFMCYAFDGCSDKLEVQQDVAWKKVCTKWGTSSSKVKEMMRTYTMKSSSSTVLTYKGKYPVSAVSYQFADDSLCAVVVLMDATTIDKGEIRSSFSDYESLGENNSSELYVRFVNNTLATITSFAKGDKLYNSVGYADLGDAVVPL